jgi:hypothetical protein
MSVLLRNLFFGFCSSAQQIWILCIIFHLCLILNTVTFFREDWSQWSTKVVLQLIPRGFISTWLNRNLWMAMNFSVETRTKMSRIYSPKNERKKVLSLFLFFLIKDYQWPSCFNCCMYVYMYANVCVLIMWNWVNFDAANEFSERLSNFGITANLISYLTKVIHQDLKTAAKSVNYWAGVTTMMPLFGGFLADAYTGRFSMVLLSSLVYLLVYIYVISFHFLFFFFLAFRTRKIYFDFRLMPQGPL